jgi:hypothetical protein
MKALVVASIAVGILHFVDSEYNEGRDAAVIKLAITRVIRG